MAGARDRLSKAMGQGQPLLSVLIPAYNEEACLADSVHIILSKLDELGVEGEVLIVDDASKDRTAEIADELARTNKRVRALHHSANQGIGGGFRTGIAQASGEWLMLIPADLALDPSELGTYLEAREGADVVVGLRSDRSDYSLFRKLVSWTNIFLVQTLFGMKLRQFQYISMYRLDALRQIEVEYWRSAFFHPEGLIKIQALGRKLVEVEVRYVPRATGRATGANPRQIVKTVRDMLHFWVVWRSRK